MLVWFHGGAWVTGSGGWDWYAGDRLAATGDIVVVTANYRLGPLGYLWLPEEGADNLGNRDQAAVLAWVHETIGAFGGDPRAVTVGGQSAGSYSAMGLALDPATSGYVHQLLLHSGPWGAPGRQPGDAAAITAEYLRLLSIRQDENTGTALRSVPVQELLGAVGQLAALLAKPGDPTAPMQPVLTGAGLPRDDWRDAMSAGRLAGKPVLISSTTDEMAAFLPPGTPLTAELAARGRQPAGQDAGPRVQLCDRRVRRDRGAGLGRRRLAGLRARACRVRGVCAADRLADQYLFRKAATSGPAIEAP